MLLFSWLIPAACFGVLSTSLFAHEYWIEPEQWAVKNGESFTAHLRNGQQFRGSSMPYLKARTEKLALHNRKNSRDIVAELGDLPAINEIAQVTGLNIIEYRSREQTIRYQTFDEFETYTRDEGIEWVLDRHRDLKLPKNHIAEVYQRYAKALLAVGHETDITEDADRLLGMPLEIVLETNPYSPDRQNGIEAQVIYNGEPLVNVQVSVFTKTDGLIAKLRSNENGRVSYSFPDTHSLPGAILLNAVHARRPTKKLIQQTGALWHTLWASTTFNLLNNNQEH